MICMPLISKINILDKLFFEFIADLGFFLGLIMTKFFDRLYFFIIFLLYMIVFLMIINLFNINIIIVMLVLYSFIIFIVLSM